MCIFVICAFLSLTEKRMRGKRDSNHNKNTHIHTIDECMIFFFGFVVFLIVWGGELCAFL